MITNRMSIPEFINELDLDQLRMVERMCKHKIEKITDQEKVIIYVFSSGMVNEGFYETEELALQAMKDYVNSKEHTAHDTLKIIKVFEYKDEVKRLLED